MNRIALFLPVMCFFSCEAPVQEQGYPHSDPVGEQFVRANQYLYRRHQDHIGAFIERVGWDAATTSSGLWIVIGKPGTGQKIREGSRVTYSFESLLLDGTPCYGATAETPKVITIGRGGVERGVEEGLQKLREDAEATFLIPPHLAHGNFGDRNRIPGNTVLIYKVKVLEVQQDG